MSRRRSLRRRVDPPASSRSATPSSRSPAAAGRGGVERGRRLGHRWEGGRPTMADRVHAIVGPTVEDGEAFFGREDRYTYPTLGFTTRLMDFSSPDVDYGAVQGADGWTATPTLAEGSDEGDNECWALGQGLHRVPGRAEEGKPLYVRVGAERAAEIADAEREHVADYRYAKQQVLDRADARLGERLDGRSFGPEPTQEAAEEKVDEYLDADLQAHLGLTGVEDFCWVCLNLYYSRAAGQTTKRDDQGWHSFDNDRAVEEDRVVETINAGTTEIGTHDAASVVKLDEVT